MSNECAAWVTFKSRKYAALKDGTIISCWTSRRKQIKPGSNGKYAKFNACLGDKIKTVYIHRFVWVYWSGKPIPKGQEVNHINHNPVDNRLCNLELVSRKENMRQAVAAGRLDGNGLHIRGTGNMKAKLTETQVLEIFHSKARRKDALKAYGIKGTCYNQIKSGITWSYLTRKKYRGKIKQK